MRSKNLALSIAGTIFGIVAVLHLLRVITGVSFILAGWNVPIWMNFFGFVATAALSTWIWWLACSRTKS